MPTATRSLPALGWMPSYPTFDRNPLDLTRDAADAGMEPPAYVVDRLKAGELRFAAEDPDAPENFPRVLTLWRANLLGSSSKGHEYFLRHVLGVEDAAVRNVESSPDERPTEVVWHEEAPTGKLDLFTTIDFRMNGSALYSDVVLPAATWYEKHDLSSTDLHPFVHSFNQAVPPPWEAKTDFDIFGRVAERFSELAGKHLGTRTDLVAAPLLHDTPDELAQPLGEVRDWKRGECEPVPGKTMPKLVPVERDYTAVYRKWRSLGPLAEQLGSSAKGIPLRPTVEIDELRAANGELDGRPALTRDIHMCEAILALSGVTNGRLAVEGFRGLEKRTGTRLADIAEEHADVRITFGDTQVQPRKVLASPEWSGMESRDRRYNPFTINVERDVPFRTLTGRQQLYVEHAWMLEYGEGLPTYRPPLNVLGVVGEQLSGDPTRKELHLRWLSPHSKWSIHSEFQDNLHMLTLFRGGPVVWISDVDAAQIEVADNDWVEVFNRNGVVTARAVVSHRIPSGVGLMYHSQDRHVNVPRSELSGTRGGTDNSVTRISMKPTHLVGGYAQLSYGFNYYGPCGTQRDEMVAVRKLLGEAHLLMQVRAQIAMVMNLDKCIGCHTCSVTCKNVWTNRRGTEYVWFNDVETKPGDRLSEAVGGPGPLEGRLGAPEREAPAPRRRAPPQACDPLLQPGAADARRLLRALDLRLRDAHHGRPVEAPAGRPARVPGDGTPARPAVGAQLGGRPRRCPGARPARPEPPGRRRGARAARVREGVHVLPPADLRALPEPVVRRVLPLGGDVQARRGRDRARRPGAVPVVAHVRERLPVQEGLLQLVDRQGREVHALLPAHRGGPADDLLGDLCRQDPVPRCRPLRRRPRAGGCLRRRRERPAPRPTLPVPRPPRPRRARAGTP